MKYTATLHIDNKLISSDIIFAENLTEAWDQIEQKPIPIGASATVTLLGPGGYPHTRKIGTGEILAAETTDWIPIKTQQ